MKVRGNFFFWKRLVGWGVADLEEEDDDLSFLGSKGFRLDVHSLEFDLSVLSFKLITDAESSSCFVTEFFVSISAIPGRDGRNPWSAGLANKETLPCSSSLFGDSTGLALSGWWWYSRSSLNFPCLVVFSLYCGQGSGLSPSRLVFSTAEEE